MNLPFPAIFAQASEDIVWLVFLVIWAIFQVIGGSRDKSGKRKGRGKGQEAEQDDVFSEEVFETESEEERRTREIQEEIRRRIEERRRLREAEDGKVPTAPPEVVTSESSQQRQHRESSRDLRDPVTSSRQKADADRDVAYHNEQENRRLRTEREQSQAQSNYQKAYEEQLERLKESREKQRSMIPDAIAQDSIEATEIGSEEIGGPSGEDFWSDSSENARRAHTNRLRGHLLDDLKSPSSTRKAIVLMEVLGPCKADRR
jgi:hypothetical protein